MTHEQRAEDTVRRCREMRASHEAIMRAALAQMPVEDGMGLLAKLYREWLERQQEAAHRRNT